MQRPSNELKDTTYELFIGALSILSIINLFLYYLIDNLIVSGVIVIIDVLLSLIFLTDSCIACLLPIQKRAISLFSLAGPICWAVFPFHWPRFCACSAVFAPDA